MKMEQGRRERGHERGETLDLGRQWKMADKTRKRADGAEEVGEARGKWTQSRQHKAG